MEAFWRSGFFEVCFQLFFQVSGFPKTVAQFFFRSLYRYFWAYSEGWHEPHKLSCWFAHFNQEMLEILTTVAKGMVSAHLGGGLKTNEKTEHPKMSTGKVPFTGNRFQVNLCIFVFLIVQWQCNVSFFAEVVKVPDNDSKKKVPLPGVLHFEFTLVHCSVGREHGAAKLITWENGSLGTLLMASCGILLHLAAACGTVSVRCGELSNVNGVGSAPADSSSLVTASHPDETRQRQKVHSTGVTTNRSNGFQWQ